MFPEDGVFYPGKPSEPPLSNCHKSTREIRHRKMKTPAYGRRIMPVGVHTDNSTQNVCPNTSSACKNALTLVFLPPKIAMQLPQSTSASPPITGSNGIKAPRRIYTQSRFRLPDIVPHRCLGSGKSMFITKPAINPNRCMTLFFGTLFVILQPFIDYLQIGPQHRIWLLRSRTVYPVYSPRSTFLMVFFECPVSLAICLIFLP